MNRDSPSRTRIQFRLSYLLYLLTVIALVLAIWRRVFEVHGGWQLNVVFAIYLAAMAAYFGIRFPILLRRLRRGRRESAARRTELSRWLDGHSQRPDERDEGDGRSESHERE